jgi:hypothetical protein
MLQAEAHHRGHAVQEQINADAKASALAPHTPSGKFQANAAWATCWAIAHNLTRAAGHLAAGHPAGFHARATTPTIRATLISAPARTASRARHIILHGPQTGSTATLSPNFTKESRPAGPPRPDPTRPSPRTGPTGQQS